MRRAVILALATTSALPRGATAQRTLVLDAGAGSSSHQLGPSGHALSLAPRFGWEDRHARLNLGGLYSRGTALGWNAELWGSGGAVFHPLTGLAVDLGAEGFASRHHAARGTRELSATSAFTMEAGSMRLRLAFGLGRASAAHGSARLSTDNVPAAADSMGVLPTASRTLDSKAFVLGAFVAAIRLGPIQVQGSLTRTQFDAPALRTGAAWQTDTPRADTLPRQFLTRYDDVMLGAGWDQGRFRIEAAVEQRLALGAFRSRAWHLQLVAPLSPDVALFGSTGHTLSRITVDLPARSYTTLGFRWTVGARHPSARRATGTLRAAAFRAEREGETVRLAVLADRVSRVEVMGDFTNWEPVSLNRESGGWWSATWPLAPGTYRINVRYDGGPWGAPRGLPSERDEFGNRVGVLLLY